MFWQIVLPNAVVLAIAVSVLAFSPATVSAPVQPHEAAVLLGGLAALVVLNLVLIRRATSPLERLAELMEDFDPLAAQDSPRLIERSSVETDKLAAAFSAMARRLRRARRESSRYMLRGQEDERLRLSHELHDEIGQSLTALMLAVDAGVETSAPAHRDQLIELREMARGLNQELHRIVVRLRPEALDDLGLRSALLALTDRFATHGLEINRQIDDPPASLDSEAELVIYRVGQEALTNALRHSGAAAVAFALTVDDAYATLRVADDGQGMNGAVEGAGLQGMRERAMLIDAHLQITSSPAGTEIRLRVPLEGRD